MPSISKRSSLGRATRLPGVCALVSTAVLAVAARSADAHPCEVLQGGSFNVASAIARGPNPGSVTIKLNTRPGEPETLEFADWTKHALLEYLDSTLNKQIQVHGGSDQDREAHLSNVSERIFSPRSGAFVAQFFSKHHVINQQRLQLLFLAHCAAYLDGNLDPAARRAVDDFFAKVIPPEVTETRRGGKPVGPPVVTGSFAYPQRIEKLRERGALALFVWAPSNLFEGINGALRTDDPKNSTEPTKPRTFDTKRWDELKQLDALIGAMLDGPIDAAGTKVKYDVFVGQLTTDAYHPLLLALGAAFPLPHPFSWDDWTPDGQVRTPLYNALEYEPNAKLIPTLDQRTLAQTVDPKFKLTP